MLRFSHFENPGNVDGFTVKLASTGQSIFIPPGRSILGALLDAGIEVAFNCGTGKCGVCEVGVIEGTPDHHKFVLTHRERAGRSVMTCCSGSLSDELVLDL